MLSLLRVGKGKNGSSYPPGVSNEPKTTEYEKCPKLPLVILLLKLINDLMLSEF